MIGVPCAIGLGGNVGDVAAAFGAALAALDATDGVRVMAVSSLYRTDPVGGPAQDDYLNAAALLASGIDPLELLALLQALELGVVLLEILKMRHPVVPLGGGQAGS